MASKENESGYFAGNQSGQREGFGDDQGARVGKPDQAAHRAPLGNSEEVGPSSGTDPHGEEGSILEGASTRRGTDEEGPAQKNVKDAAKGASGSSGNTDGGRSTGMGAEGAQGIHNKQPQSGAAGSGQRGSEPLQGRDTEHKGSYGGEGGAARTSSDQRE